jgi:LCCL domain-containing protein
VKAIAILATMVLVGACTTIPGLTATPGASAVVTPGPVASPSVVATTSSTTTPTSPSVTATPVPAPSGTPLPTQPGASPSSGDFGANTLLFSDDFSDTSGGWATPSYNEGTNITYDPDETLRLDLHTSSAAYSASGAIDDQTWDVVRVEGTLLPEAGDTEGYFGLLCGAAADDLVGAVISNTDRQNVFIRQTGLNTQVLDMRPVTLPVTSGSPVEIRLECAGTATGSLRMQLSVGTTVVAVHQDVVGPATFDRVGVFGDAISESFVVHLDDVEAFGGVAADLPPAASLPPPPPAATPTSEPVTWYSDASDHRGQNGQDFVYHCPPGGTAGSIYGTDRYTDDSSVCTAAVHAGFITLAAGGDVTIEIQPDAETYVGTERNGVSSGSWSGWLGSFVFVTP